MTTPVDTEVLALSGLHLAELNYKQTQIRLYAAMAQIKTMTAEITSLKAAQELRQCRLEEQSLRAEGKRLQEGLKSYCDEIQGEYGVEFASCSWDDVTGVLHVIGTSER